MRSSKFGNIQIFIILITAIYLAEFFVMILLKKLSLPISIENFIDGLILVILIYPLLYLLAFRPLMYEIKKCKGLEEALYTSNELDKYLLKTIPFGMDIVDQYGNIMFLNEKLEAIFGKEAIGKKCWMLYKDDKMQCVDCPLREEIKVGKTKTIEAKDVLGGKVFQINHTGMIYQGKKAILEVFQDITERKLVEEKMKEVVELKSEFTSIVSHELRTPLAAIKEGINLVIDGSAGPINKNQEEFLGIAKNNIDRLARLINDVLDFQKLEAGKIEFKMEENNINDIVRDIERQMVSLVSKKGLKLVVNLDNNIPRIKFDKDKITQVLSNLVNNAISFTEKGNITITSVCQGNNIVLGIRDTGIGIKKEDMPKLFQAFKQLISAKQRKIGGTGLGLAICKNIVEAHQGKIWVESEFGNGSVFYFTLPI
ncbi:MAG: PAS domain-containing sensor histidine kinase [Candidatus Omnitrophota bacterium]